MLSKDEVERLALVLEDLRKCIKNKTKSTLSLETQYWLALQLEQVNIQCTAAIEQRQLNRPEQKIMVNRAKEHLMLKYEMTENEAHLFLIKTATDNRTTKFQVARKLLDAETK
jgi:AmiR/NasT family two-component response regulator